MAHGTQSKLPECYFPHSSEKVCNKLPVSDHGRELVEAAYEDIHDFLHLSVNRSVEGCKSVVVSILSYREVQSCRTFLVFYEVQTCRRARGVLGHEQGMNFGQEKTKKITPDASEGSLALS